MQSKATTVAQYLAELPPDRREAIEQVRKVILKNLDRGADGKSGYEEGMTYGMIGYYVPHRVFPAGYHCDPKMPLPYAGLASQKNHMSLYLMTIYGDGPHWFAFRQAWEKTGKKLDMGKCCIRFKKVEDLALDLIGNEICKTPVKKYVEAYQKSLVANEKAAGERSAARKAAKGDGAPAKKAKASAPKKKVASVAAKQVRAKKTAKKAANR